MTGRWEFKIPKDFSLISNTEETLDAICSLISSSKKFKPGQAIHVDHLGCENMDLAASAVLDAITLEIMKELPPGTFRIDGSIPLNGQVRQLMINVGLPRQLGINIKPDPGAFILPLPLQRGRRQQPGKYEGQSEAERVAGALANHLKECFQKAAGYELPLSVTRQIVKWLPEVIGNAEDHSATDDWWAISYLVPHDPAEYQRTCAGVGGAFLGEVQLTVFNFGRSFFESLNADTTAPTLKEAIRDLAKRHSLMGWFIDNDYSERDLWTLYALQDGVSRFAGRPGDIDRGWGTVRMIQAFQRLGGTVRQGLIPRMILISGDTQISFDPKYQLKYQDVADGQRSIIAFNSENSLEQRPDKAYVRSLKSFFPGTLLAFRFFIDKKHLETLELEQTQISND